jgi:hypothetical protein
MRAMKGTRTVARLALCALAFAALLPLTASARMLASDGPVEHCHRLNVDSIIDPDPLAPEGPSQPRKASCPLCAFAAAGAPAAPPSIPCFIPLDAGTAPAEVALPLARAPPHAHRA